MKTMRITTTTIALTGALLLGACGDDDSNDEASNDLGLAQPDTADGDAADLPDPCTLLTEDDAVAVVGSPVAINGPQQPDGGVGLECVYVGPKAGSIAVEQSIIVRTRADDGIRLGDPTELSGLDEPHVNEMLHVLTWHPDGLTVEVQVIAHDGVADSVDNLETLASQVDDALG